MSTIANRSIGYGRREVTSPTETESTSRSRKHPDTNNTVPGGGGSKKRNLTILFIITIIIICVYFFYSPSPSPIVVVPPPSASSSSSSPSSTFTLPLTVHLVPHSHLDAGWLRTFDEYYTYPGQHILASIMHGLALGESRRFTWTDLAFLLRFMEREANTQIDEELTRNQCQAIHDGIRHCVCGDRSGPAASLPAVSHLHLVACLVFAPPFQLSLVGGSYTGQDSALSSPLERLEGFEYGRGEWGKIESRLRRHVSDRLGGSVVGVRHSEIPSGPTPFTIGWEIDLFGHSGSEPAIAEGVGMHAMVLGRVESRRHKRMKEEKAREFWWPQSQANFASYQPNEEEGWSTQRYSHHKPLLTSTLYQHYSSPPCLHDLHHRTLVRSSDTTSPSMFSFFHIVHRFLAHLVLDRINDQQTSHMMILIGDDFRYHTTTEVNRLYTNIELIANAINTMQGTHNVTDIPENNKWKELLTEEQMRILIDTYGDHNFFIRVSNAAEYIETLHTADFHRSTPTHSIFPLLAPPVSSPLSSLSPDFFPYTDLDFDNVWSGYYANRPMLKHWTKSLLSMRRSLQTAITIHILSAKRSHTEDVTHLFELVSELRTTLFQPMLLALHHDAITGTHRPKVGEDYLRQLSRAETRMNEIRQLVGAAQVDASTSDSMDAAVPTVTASEANRPAPPADDEALEARADQIRARYHAGELDSVQLRSHMSHLADVWRAAHHETGSASDLPVWLQPSKSPDLLPPFSPQSDFLLDVSWLFSSGIDSDSELLLKLFNPISEERYEVLPIRVVIDCHILRTYGDDIRIGERSQFEFRDVQTHLPLTVQLPKGVFNDDATFQSQCQYLDQTRAEMDIHIGVNIHALTFQTVSVRLVSVVESSSTPPTLPGGLVHLDRDGAWIRGATHDSMHTRVRFSSRTGRLIYDVVRRDKQDDRERAITFEHSHHLYVSSTRPQCNSGAYLFRSIFPSAYGLLTAWVGVGWLIGFLLVFGLFASSIWIRARLSAAATNLWTRSGQILPGPNSINNKRTHVGLQIAQRVLAVIDHRAYPIRTHALLGAVSAAIWISCILQGEWVSHATVRWLLSPSSDEWLLVCGVMIGMAHGVLAVQAGGGADQDALRAKKHDDHDTDSPVRLSNARARLIISSALSFVLAFAFVSIAAFLFLPSWHAREITDAGTANISEKQHPTTPTFRIEHTGPLFTEVSYTRSNDVWESIRVYHSPIDSSSDFTPWMNEVLEYRWSVEPCQECQLATRIKHTHTTGVHTTQREFQTTNSEQIDAHRETEFTGRTSWRVTQALSALFDGAANIATALFSSIDSSLFFTDDGISLLPRRSPSLLFFLGLRQFPFSSGSLFEDPPFDKDGQQGGGFTIFIPNQAFGGTRFQTGFEISYQRWLRRDDEKGLDYGILEGYRLKHCTFILPRFENSKDSRMEHIRRSRRYQLFASQPVMPLSVTRSLRRTSLPPVQPLPTQLLARRSNEVMILSLSIVDQESDMVTTIFPIGVAPDGRPSAGVLVALRLWNRETVEVEVTLHETCMRLESSPTTATAQRRIICPCWQMVDLSLDRVRTNEAHAAARCNSDAATRPIQLQPGQILAVIMWTT